MADLASRSEGLCPEAVLRNLPEEVAARTVELNSSTVQNLLLSLRSECCARDLHEKEIIQCIRKLRIQF